MSFPYLLSSAPIAGVSNRAFREKVRSFGVDLAWGEMVSARALAYNNKRTWELMDIEDEDHPRLVQLSGSEPDQVARAAEIAAQLGADIIDLNMGCPVPKVVRNNEGCALMRQPQLAVKLVRAARSAGLPVSCKFRSGWDKGEENAPDFACRMEQAGAAFITIHGRTRQQMYSGQADWSVISRVKTAVGIPVIGNGDVFSGAAALAMLEQTGCDGIMLGRGLLGNPWLIPEIRAALAGESVPPRPSPQQVAEQALSQLRRQIERSVYWVEQREGAGEAQLRLGEDLAVRSMRNQLGWYTKGQRGGAQLRAQLNQAVSYGQVEAIFAAWLERLPD